jgi:tRNA threonylcarbamoyladenosine biosynthesis protein TsaB
VLGTPADGPLDPDAGALAAVAVRRLAAGDDLSSTAPLYLRRPDATPPGAGKSVLGR